MTKFKFDTPLGKSVGIAAVTATLLLQSSAFATAAADRYAGFVIDANNGKVLFSKNADEPRFPASLTKMMTLYMLFDAMKAGKVSLQTQMKVSKYAAARPPTKLRLQVGSTLSVEEAILGLVTLSANDASVVIAEHLAGSEAAFAQRMTAKARLLGMSRTTFRNANGLPNPGQTTTARDMATLGIALREHFPKQFAYFKTKSFNFRGRQINSHNRLVGKIQGVDGIKTGYINASGFNLVSSLMRDDKKIVGVVMGGATAAARDKHMADLLTKYLASASTRDGGQLVARPAPVEPRVTVAALAPEPSYAAPNRVPLPRMRETINERIAEAYGADADAGHAIARIAGTPARPIVGREALRAAMARPSARPGRVPTANALAPVPPGSIPGGDDFDPTTTGSIKAALGGPVSSPWVVQIAAMPDRDRAIEMLAEAKRRGGSALVRAEGFTEQVGNGSQALHRARFAGFQSKTEASQACAALKKQSYNCYAVAN
jgi:D-alanyl-D-alanine carboxypeptidase